MDIITAGTALTVTNKLLGKTAEAIADDLAKLYASGRDKIFAVAIRKTPNTEDGFQTNLRVARDVFFNGSFTDESICAEYFGGILASSRSQDGRDDRGVYYTDIIKSLSSQQLLLHYFVYRSLNILWLRIPREEKRPNPGMADEIQKYFVWFPTKQLEFHGISPEKDMIALESKGLIGNNYESMGHKLENNLELPYTKIQPTTLGIQLYAVAHNRLSEWRLLPNDDFGEFKDIEMLPNFTFSLEDLLSRLNLNSNQSEEGQNKD